MAEPYNMLTLSQAEEEVVQQYSVGDSKTNAQLDELKMMMNKSSLFKPNNNTFANTLSRLKV